MAKIPLVFDTWNGGLAATAKRGTKGAFRFGQSVDIHNAEDSLKILTKTTKDSGSTVTDLVIDMVRTANGDTYFFSEGKKLYKRTAAGTWSTVDTVAGDTNGMGMHYWRAKDTMYLATDQSITTYGLVTGTPTFTDNKYDTFTDQSVDVNSASTSYPQSTKIQGHWRMEESSGNRADSSTNGNNLTDNNSVGSSTTRKEGVRSADFEADSNHSLSIADGTQTGLDITSDLTIIAWVRPESQPGSNLFHVIASKRDGAGGGGLGYEFFYRDNAGTKQLGCRISSNGTSETTVAVTQTLSNATWYHVAMVYDASAGEADFYVDAVASGATQTGLPTSIFNNSASFMIADDNEGTGSVNFDGLVDDVLVYNHELTSGEITQAFQASTASYTLGTTVSETDANRFYFTPEADPHVSVVVPIADKGTGDWTVVIHDDGDTAIASKTVTNASLTSSANNTFTFTTNWRPILEARYHLHITSTVADGTISAGASALKLKAARLVDPKSGVHPIMEFTDFIAIGNERYLTTYDGLLTAATESDDTLPSSWDLHRIILPSGYEIQCLARFDEYIVMGAELRGDNTNDFSKGLLVFWDGTSDTFNFFLEVEEGGVQWMLPIKNKLYFGAGLRGEIFVTNGEDYAKLKQLPKTSSKKYVRSLFSSATIYQGVPLFGYSKDTDSTTFKHGLYAYTSKEAPFTDVWSYDHVISTGTTTGTGVQIGAVKAFGTDLFIGWKDSSTYGVDIVEPTNNPYATASWEALIFDNNLPHKDKKMLGIKARHAALPTGGSIQLGYQIDRSGSFTTDTANSTADSTETVFYVDKYFKELEVTVIMGATTTSPEVFDVVVDIDDRRETSRSLSDA